MAEENIAFKSFYYSLGTTSFRMQNFNQKIEQQLDLLNQFWEKPEYTNEKWESNEPIQEAYYSFIKETKQILLIKRGSIIFLFELPRFYTRNLLI